MCALWVNIAFSYRAIALLAGPSNAGAFGDVSFRQGLAARSTVPWRSHPPKHAGHRSRWVVGGPKKEADILVIVAADDVEDLETFVKAIKGRANDERLDLAFRTAWRYVARCAARPRALRIQGWCIAAGRARESRRRRAISSLHAFLTRPIRAPASLQSPGSYFCGQGSSYWASGASRRSISTSRHRAQQTSRDGRHSAPTWYAGACVRMFRRLESSLLCPQRRWGCPSSSSASLLVGRWPSGAPIMRTPAADDAALAGDMWANNHFIFNDHTRPSVLRPIPGYVGDGFAQATADLLGNVCPHFAHVRKTIVATLRPTGKPHDSMLRMILRRGIPFGPPIVGVRRAVIEVDSARTGFDVHLLWRHD